MGSKSRSFQTPFGRCGFLICNDRWNTDLARIPVLDGAQYLLIPDFGSTAKDQDQAVLARARENGVPIVQANVGVTLIVSKGEVVNLSRKETSVTCATIEVPAPATSRNRDQQERRFLRWRKKEMPQRYVSYMKRVKRKSAEKDPKRLKLRHDSKGRIISR